ncbi:PIN domain-containing protein [Geomonas sp. Red276]
MNRLFLDTSAYSRLMRGQEEVAALLDQADEVHLSAVVVGELLSGFRKGNSEKRNRQILDKFLSITRVSILPLTHQTSERYALILDYLRRNGTPIPTNDLWIAASSMEHGLNLITADRHFLKLPQILVTLVE